MKRLEEISRSRRLARTTVFVTGCGYKPAKSTFNSHVKRRFSLSESPFYDYGSSADCIPGEEGESFKLNIGSAVAGVLALNGASVIMVSKSDDKLRRIKECLDAIVGDDYHISYAALDLLDEEQVNGLANRVVGGERVYWVQSVGLGAGSYSLDDDNPYLPLDKIPLELVEKEANVVLRSTHLMMQALLPKFRKQDETRIAIISSMSAVRGYSYGAAHCAAKGAIDRYTNAAMLALWRDNIFVTTIRPGAVDTGMYDSPAVQEAVKRITDDEYGCNWKEEGICLMPPTAVAEAAYFAFTAPSHITSINMVAQGQFPNEGS